MKRALGGLSAAVTVALLATPAAAQVKTETTPMSFEACLATIRAVSSDLGVAPVNIVETRDVRMVRFPTSNGSVLVTCSRPDGKMAITHSPKGG